MRMQQQWGVEGVGLQITEKLPSYCSINIGYYDFVVVVPIIECTFCFSSALYMKIVIQNTLY